MADHPGAEVVSTGRLLIREFTGEDWDAFRSVSLDPWAERIWGQPVHEDFLRAAFARALEAGREPERSLWALAVVDKESGRMAGYLDFSVRGGGTEAEFSIMIGGPCRGRGYGPEACRAMMDFGFRELGVRRVVSSVDSSNAPSRRMLEKAGMRLERQWRRPADAPPGSSWASGCVYVAHSPKA